jgi:hypothetical protein
MGLGYLGWCNTDWIVSICVTLPKVARARRARHNRRPFSRTFFVVNFANVKTALRKGLTFLVRLVVDLFLLLLGPMLYFFRATDANIGVTFYYFESGPVLQTFLLPQLLQFRNKLESTIAESSYIHRP